MSRPVCEGVRQDGSACRAPALPDSSLCWVHDPTRAEATAKARSAGGTKGGKLKALHGRRRRLDSQAALGQFVTGLVYDLVEGRQDPEIARAALYGCSILRQLAEHGLERRLAEVERLLAPRRTG